MPRLPQPLLVLLLLPPLLLTAGCVSKKDFLAKSHEAELATSALAKERQKSAELAVRAAQLEGQLGEVQNALAAAAAERDRLRADLAAARGAAARLEGQLTEATDQRDTLARQLAIVQQSASQKDVSIERLTLQYDTLIKDLERQKGELSQRLTALSGRLAETESRIASLTEERDRLDGERLRLDVRVLELTTELAGARQALAAAQAEVASAQQALAANQKALAATEAELAAARQALGRTKEELAERERKLREATATYDKLVADLKGEIAEGQVKITRLRDTLTVNLVDKILFDSGSTVIKPRGQEVLRKVAGVLKTVTDKRIHIEGHTDNVPISAALQSRYPTNWELSAARATVVARFLEEKGGISPKLLAAVGYGEHQPVASNDTPEGRAENRRIEIVLRPINLEAVLQ